MEKSKLLGEFHTQYGALDYAKRKKRQEDAEKKKRKSGITGLFRYASRADLLLLWVGLFFAVLHGASFPVLALVFGQMTNTFMRQTMFGFRSSDNTTNQFEESANETFFDDGTPSSITSPNISNALSNDGALSSDEFTAYMARFSFYYFCIGLSVLITSFLQTFCWELACERQVYRLRRVFFAQLLRQDVSWYDTNKQGDLNTKLTDDLERIREGIGSKFSMVLQYLATFVSGLCVGLYANWRLTLIIIAIGPLFLGSSAYMARVAASSASREQLKYSIAGGVAEEVLTCIRTVTAFGGETREAKRYEKALEEGRILAMNKYYVLSIGLFFVFFVMYSSYGLAFWYGSQLIAEGIATPGSVFTVFFSVLAGAFSIGNGLPYINAVSTAIGAASTIFEIIDRVPNIDPYSDEGIIPDKLNGLIEFRGVEFIYPSRKEVKVLKGLNLTISPSQTVALVGASGAGKSTIVSLLMRFYDPIKGEILIDGIPLNKLNLNWLRSNIGVVSQEPVLFGVSIRDNIRYGRDEVTEEEIVQAAKLANAHYFIKKFPKGYDTLVGDRGAQMSGGQKQRIAIARAVVRDPKILLLDEATSALDSHSEGIVQKALDNAMKGRTTIIVAHRLSTIRNADLIYAMKDGLVHEQGTHSELMSKEGLYHSLVTTQAKTAESETTDKSENEVPEEDSKNGLGSSTHSLNSLVSDGKDFDEIVNEVPVSRLMKMNAPEWYWLALGIIACSMTGAVSPIFAFFYGEVFSTFTLTGEELESATLFWTGMFVVLAVVSGFAYWMQIVCMTTAAEKLLARLRALALENVLRQPIYLFDSDNYSAGKLITRLSRDAPLVKAVAGLRAGQLTSSVVTLLAALTIAFVYGWKLALLLLVCVPILAMAAYHQTSIIRKTQMRDMKLMDKAGNLASESVKNVTTVQALGRERHFNNLYVEYLLTPFREAKRQALYYAIMFALAQTVVYMMYAGAFRFGAYLIEKGEMAPNEVYRVFFALAFCATFIGTAMAYLQDYTKSKIAAAMIFQLIDRESEINPTSCQGVKPDLKGKVTFRNVRFSYPNRPDVQIIRGLDLTIEPGQTVALVGGSGCGKSTLISLLERFYTPDKGEILVDDIDIRAINLSYLRNNIGLVTQEPVLFDCTVRENITYGAVSSGREVLFEEIIRAAKAANIHDFINSLPARYETMCGTLGTQMSGGQKQRIAIARALIRNPKILLLDEATSALDTESEKIVQEALDKARLGRTSIVVAHRLSTIQNADNIAVIHNGRVVELGTHEQLKANRDGIYYQLIKRQQL